MERRAAAAAAAVQEAAPRISSVSLLLALLSVLSLLHSVDAQSLKLQYEDIIANGGYLDDVYVGLASECQAFPPQSSCMNMLRPEETRWPERTVDGNYQFTINLDNAVPNIIDIVKDGGLIKDSDECEEALREWICVFLMGQAAVTSACPKAYPYQYYLPCRDDCLAFWASCTSGARSDADIINPRLLSEICFAIGLTTWCPVDADSLGIPQDAGFCSELGTDSGDTCVVMRLQSRFSDDEMHNVPRNPRFVAYMIGFLSTGALLALTILMTGILYYRTGTQRRWLAVRTPPRSPRSSYHSDSSRSSSVSR